MDSKEISRFAFLGFNADGSPCEGQDGVIAAHKVAFVALTDAGDLAGAAQHEKEIARREASRFDFSAPVVSHKAANLDERGEPKVYSAPTSLKVQS